ncbi:MAG: hypothetical protein FWD68_18075 [Alphaproteobacteria bacterium]|nr:hypothetical protein [Alphaproteobacteria bacterium]
MSPHPFPIHGRTRTRLRLLLSQPMVAAAAGLGARMVQLASTLLIIPVLSNYLGAEHLAIWLAASSLMDAFSFLDLGIGSHLVNQIAASRDTSSQAQASVSSAFTVLILFSTLAAALVSLAFVLGAFQFREPDSSRAFFITCLTLCLLSPLSLVWRIRLALAEMTTQSLWDVMSALGTFCAILLCVFLDGGMLPAVAAFCITPLVVNLLNARQLFRAHPDIRPRVVFTGKWREMLATLRAGAPFLLQNAVRTISFSFDALLALNLLPARQAVEFSVLQKMASAVQTATAVAVNPFWPHFRLMTAESNRRAAAAVIAGAIGVALVLSLPISITLYFFGERLISLWTRGAITAPPDLLFALGVWIPVFGIGAAVISLMTIPSLVKLQIKLGIIAGLTCLVAKFIAGRLWGGAGFFYGNTIGLFALLIIPGLLAILRSVLGMSRHNPGAEP